MAGPIYTAEATVTGGRAEGHGVTSDDALCFEGALGVIARRERVEPGDVSIDSRVSLLPTAERGFTIAVELNVILPEVADADEAARLVTAAHAVCPYSNATRGNIEVKLTANGAAIS